MGSHSIGRTWIVLALAAGLAPLARAESPLFNVARSDLGATAVGTGAPFNRDWPAINAIGPEKGKERGTLFGSPMVGGRVEIKLVQAVDIKAIEVTGLDYNGTRQPKAIDIFVDGKLAKQVELPETPGKPHRIPLETRGRQLAVVVKEEHPIRTLAGGRAGPNYGGWKRIAVLSTQDISELMKPPAGYAAALNPSNIQPTQGAIAEGEIKVIGKPRQAEGWPRTLWDKQDIAHYQQMLQTSEELKKQYAALKKAMDARMAQPLGIPQPRKGEDGKWIHLPDREVGKVHNALSLDIANMATVYALSGDAKYGNFCKELLLAYAQAFPNYGVGARPGFTHDPSKVFDQRLSDATWLIQLARGYDLIHDLPSITHEEREKIEKDLLRGSAEFVAANAHMLRGATNWSAIATTSVLITGYAIGAQDLVDLAMWGPKGTREKPTGGVQLHFSEKCIDADGMWSEGSTGYQFMAMEALVADAEILWRHGVDMYSYRNAALKQLFDSPIRFAYPNLQTPAIHDGGGGSIVGYEANLWEYAYLRYGDPKYLTVLSKAARNLGAQFQKFPVSVLFDRDPGQAPPADWKSFNFFGVGYGINRITSPAGTVSMLLDYGPNRSHGHPDKLNVDLYAFDGRLVPDPGSIWYEQPLYKNWYATTVAHNTLVVDENSQRPADATQIVYGSAQTLAMQRGVTSDAYSGVTMDRSLFLTADYMADLFGAFSQTPHTMDLAWHLMGELESSLPLKDYAFPEPRQPGYSALTEVKQAATDQSWLATVKGEKGVARFIAAGSAATEVIVGRGYLGAKRPATILLRRGETKATIYGSVVDISGAAEPVVQNVSTAGDVKQGYGLLKVTTRRGTDLCFAAYRPGKYRAGDLETDALQAQVVMEGAQVRAMFLGGGTELKAAAAWLKRSEMGLAYLEKSESGSYIVGNPSAGETTLTVALPALAQLQTHLLDNDGRRTGPAKVSLAAGAVTVVLAGGARVEFAAAGVPSCYDYRQQVLQKRAQEQASAEAQERDAAIKRSRQRTDAASAAPLPAGTVIVVQAETFSAEGGGAVKVADNKTAAIGTSLSGWDGIGHWLEWKVAAPADGYYNLAVCYATQQAGVVREMMVNGQVQESAAPLRGESTGGWCNGSDDWTLATPLDPVSQSPLLVKLQKGENIVRLTNSGGGGMNLDYLLFTSPDVKAARSLVK